MINNKDINLSENKLYKNRSKSISKQTAYTFANSLAKTLGIFMIAGIEEQLIQTIATLNIENYKFIPGILPTSLFALAGRDLARVIDVEYAKSKQLELSDNSKEKIFKDGIYHFTSKECAEAIIKSGYYIPTKGIIRNHFSKSEKNGKFADLVYMFAGKPPMSSMLSNLDTNTTGEFFAVRHKPDLYDINNYRERLEDSAITHDGRLDISHNKPELVRMGIFINEKNELDYKELNLNEKYEITPAAKKMLHKKSQDYLNFFSNGFNKNLKLSSDKVHAYKKSLKGKNDSLPRKINISRFLSGFKKQYQQEQSRHYYSLKTDAGTYILTSVGKENIDGKFLNKYLLVETNSNKTENIPVGLYTDDFDENTLDSVALMQFFKNSLKTIDSYPGVINYLGKPVLDYHSSNINIEYDSKYKNHILQKNESKKIADLNEKVNNSEDTLDRDFNEKVNNNDDKLDEDFLSNLYKETPEKDITEAYAAIKLLKELEKNKSRNNIEINKRKGENQENAITNDYPEL